MQGVGARLDPHVYNRSVPPAVFSRGVLLGIEFLNGIDGERAGGISGEMPLPVPLIRLLLVAISNWVHTLNQQNVRSQTPAIAAGGGRD